MLPAIPLLVQAGMALVASYGGYWYYDQNLRDLDGDLNMPMLKFDLNINIFGQTEALNALVKKLNEVPSGYGADVIVLFGGVGVGKTLALSLIRQNFSQQRVITSVIQQNLEDLSQSQELHRTLKSNLCRVKNGFALVTVDNADISSVDLWRFVKAVDNICLQFKIKAKVVIGAQLFRETSSENVRDLISHSFKSEDEYTKYINDKNQKVCSYFNRCSAIMFRPISLDTLKMCISASAKTLTRMDLTEKQMGYLLAQITEVGLDYVPGGCKSVENYVALLHDGL
ncbi:uncharacterized protein LOC132197029 [Neocloeon triangulifer]|uniref:uncharacterized protein LOC132197029 n=1 Tax=Neocloeon triangulifer TaxID=2078957 RepID=UPI00286F9FB7|nr:uncharacterized protein LOC132197029 [Neocloeon triangulifer]